MQESGSVSTSDSSPAIVAACRCSRPAVNQRTEHFCLRLDICSQQCSEVKPANRGARQSFTDAVLNRFQVVRSNRGAHEIVQPLPDVLVRQ